MAKSPGGRPSKYSASALKKAAKLALLGLTDVQMAAALDIAKSTLNLWKKEHPEFAEALRAGKDEADAEVVASLLQRAVGYKHQAVKIFADAKTGAQKVVRYTEHYPPDTLACMYWLNNRKPDLWKAKPVPAGEEDTPPESKDFTFTVVDGRLPDADPD